jgi:hypothetical protein
MSASRPEPRPTIVCVDCGGTAHLITLPPNEEGWQPGDVVAYRCADCLDRWDVVLTEEDLAG